MPSTSPFQNYPLYFSKQQFPPFDLAQGKPAGKWADYNGFRKTFKIYLKTLVLLDGFI